MKKYKFPNNSWFMLDRTVFDCSNIEFKLIENGINTNDLFVELTPTGKKQFINRIKSRSFKWGEDTYLISLVIEESKGILVFCDDKEDSNCYNYINNLTERKNDQ